MSDSTDAESATDEIMLATYRALCTHGYPNTSIAKIADEFEKSKSLLYYHYDDKEDLLEDFLAFLLDRLEAELDEVDHDDPREHLLALVDRLLPSEMDDEAFQFRRAILEIRSQAPYHGTYRAQFERSDELFLAEFVAVIERGIEEGQFRAVNAEEAAEFIYSAAYGAIERGVTLEDPDVIEQNRAIIREYVASQLLSYA
jgi:AcrR family transcriptional regulator